ncbi:hypothetical protein V7S43_006679 [Phytophthora oleae]|uniref:PDEase domain-containing protein n=1 Tax=Phytophthora oleae TaxID=2107226 RepID=A0ABD3FNV5_9STRA
MTEDLTYVEIPMNALTAPECVVVLQMMLFEASFEFQNLIPEWSENVVSSVFESLIRSVSTEFQSRLAVEQVEWATVTDRLQVNRLPERRKPDTETHQENEGDVLLDHEADLRGRQLILKLRGTGLRVTHSSDGSSSGEPPQSKRSQHGPPRPQVPSTLSALSTPSLNSLPVYETRSDSTHLESGTPMSEDRSSSQTPMTDTRIPSVIGTSRASDDPSSGIQTSRGSSSDSMMSMSRGASSHMPLSAGGLAMIAQSADAGGSATDDAKS